MRLIFIIILLIGGPAVRGGSSVSFDAPFDPTRPAITAPLPPELARTLDTRVFDEARARAILRVVRLDEKGGEGPAIFGAYSLVGDSLRFDPQFPLGAGAKYRATLLLPGREPQHVDHAVPAAAPTEAVRIEKIYPSSDKLPANLLKFYVHFSGPVRQTDHIFDQLHILDQAGKPVYDPWRRFQQWSDDGKRLTLWVHPGRVKQGVNLREDFGPVLKPDHQYTLVIDADVLDLSGRAISARFEKRFIAIAEDHQRLLLSDWKLAVPKAAMRDPLVVSFTKPLDHALMQRLISVRDESGKSVEGLMEPGENEASCSFRPAQPWQMQHYVLHVNDLLEDLAGNTPVRVFDTDMEVRDTRSAVTDLPFSPQ